ncbi:DNA-binding SARP family transcriptional activator [Kribbella voronezhensis]|uniref:DNA-binding SARP family transcriptional activator n=1 Tax=Kribbella voronezhensis TaxID=2512212 RepID=A0A4R7T7Q1_9ACTN|nr:AfsR/SARP family transcriptional regulator [Kribbella voronezhensis]TDU87147.1 DNA-binding SARP family transcriptional activator [Kribbella voronezhensis]
MTADVEYRLLGPVQLRAGGRPVELKRRQERLLLAILLLEPGKVVPAERLVGLLWPEEGPGHPKRALQVYASRLRAVLAKVDPETRLEGGAEGYAVLGPAGRTDWELFEALVREAKATQDLERRRKVLLDALALWRGPALAEVTEEHVRRRLAAGLDEARWEAQELRVAAELELGRHQDLLPELADLSTALPFRETIASAYMLALYRSGRQADALAVYTDLVRRLADELGTTPGESVQELQLAILRQDSALDLQSKNQPLHQLPADNGSLRGHGALLGELMAELSRSGRPDGVPAVVCLYGAGRSAVAIRLAHQVAREYPDGQLFARLQDSSGEPVPAQAVLGSLLRSLGVDDADRPPSVEERASVLRSRLAGRSVLLVLDEAADAGQLRPLLPADGRCAVIVTAKQPLLGLEDAVQREVRSDLRRA